jgi:hypothetical protein
MAAKHSQLFPWYVGIVVIVAFEAMFGFQFFAGPPTCGPQAGPIFIALLIVLPAVYLVLMYLALKSQP